MLTFTSQANDINYLRNIVYNLHYALEYYDKYFELLLNYFDCWYEKYFAAEGKT